VKGVFSARDLLEISPLLESGYRTEDGKGPLFMGAFGGGWNDMDDSERKRLAGHVREKLARIGVREVMLYDERKALQVHYVGERNEYPGWDASGSKAPSSRRSSAPGLSGART
jgi:hypothetical protein